MRASADAPLDRHTDRIAPAPRVEEGGEVNPRLVSLIAPASFEAGQYRSLRHRLDSLPRKRDPAPRSPEHRDPDGRKAAPRPLRGVAIAPARRPPRGGARPLRSRRGRHAALDPGPRLPADRALGRWTPYGGGGGQDSPEAGRRRAQHDRASE